IGNVYYQLGKLDSALIYFERSLKLSKEHGISETEGNALSSIGMVYSDQGEFQKALTFLNGGLKIHADNNFKANLLETQNAIGKVYLRINQEAKALPYLNNTIESATGNGPINALKEAHLLRGKAFQEIGNIANALEDQKKFQLLNDSIFNTTKSQQIEELRTIYEAEKKEQQIAFQEKEITVLEQQASISNLQKILLGAGLLLALLGLYALRQKMKHNKLERQRVEAELDFKKKELTTHALHLAKKNEVLEGLKQKAKELKTAEGDQKGYQQLIRTIDFDLQDDNNWKNFAKYFEEVHKDFNGNVKRKYPDVTSNELRLLALLKMNLTSKEIANILNISQEGIKKARYRLRKKLDISTEESLQDLVMTL
ncbi:MAG: tetratricopeptide repeat protein, partial [Eudoraea sp.]|nr:tetratricopeptide repeat protein [Eudoraea sp.]